MDAGVGIGDAGWCHGWGDDPDAFMAVFDEMTSGLVSSLFHVEEDDGVGRGGPIDDHDGREPGDSGNRCASGVMLVLGDQDDSVGSPGNELVHELHVVEHA